IGTVNAYNLVKAFGGSPTSVDAKLEISPKSGVKFGKSTAVDTVSKPKTVTIKNASSKKSAITLSISSESADAPFAVSSECITSLEPGTSCKVSVTFSPTNTMEQTGTLIINDNETGAPQMIPLSGTGKEPRA
ncbi:choice-of-anchor D domain-containing protein, partial [Candidatus Binatus sp.]|uniref:choice-of-anchor D domain-containing protein n=1 Tax=Candidatus Binatus sp. TaxID=2811406 RepID=UPI003C4ACF7D